MGFFKLYPKIHELEFLIEKILTNQTIDISLEELFIVLKVKEFHKIRSVINSLKSELLDGIFHSFLEFTSHYDCSNFKENGIIFRVRICLNSCLNHISDIEKVWEEINDIRDELMTTSGGISKQDKKVLIGLMLKKREVFLRFIYELLSEVEVIDKEVSKIGLLLPVTKLKAQLRCPITGESCNKPISMENRDVFVGLQFSSEHYNTLSLKEILAEALNPLNLNLFFADEHYEPTHISCEICHKIQKVSLCIFEISDGNPNVMFELGLACNQGKIAILLAKQGSRGTKISDLAGFHRIQYEDLIECRRLLSNFIKDSNIIRERLLVEGA